MFHIYILRNTYIKFILMTILIIIVLRTWIRKYTYLFSVMYNYYIHIFPTLLYQKLQGLDQVHHKGLLCTLADNWILLELPYCHYLRKDILHFHSLMVRCC